MNPLTIAIVSAITALVSAVVGPFMSLIVASRQIRASVISNNRERWSESLRDSIAEYIALVMTTAMVRQALEEDPLKAVRADADLRQVVERTVMIKNKILLMINLGDELTSKLGDVVEVAYQSLMSDARPSLDAVRSDTEAITRAGREVLRVEWARVKRGD